MWLCVTTRYPQHLLLFFMLFSSFSLVNCFFFFLGWPTLLYLFLHICGEPTVELYVDHYSKETMVFPHASHLLSTCSPCVFFCTFPCFSHSNLHFSILTPWVILSISRPSISRPCRVMQGRAGALFWF